MEYRDYIKLWDDFLEAWPASRLETMTLDDYTDLERDDSLTYWLEFKTQKLGSIMGGSAYKWGVYRASETKKVHKFGLTDGSYRWEKKYGDTAQEVFEHVKQMILDIVDAAQRGALEEIEKLPHTWPIVKWKIAYLYQDRDNPCLFPYFHRRRLCHYARNILGGERIPDRTQLPKLYSTLIEDAGITDMEDFVLLAKKIWTTLDQDAGDAEENTISSPVDDDTPTSTTALNIILHGPPGTGKTWSAMREIHRICHAPEVSIHELRAQGRADIITFHQSYGYEEFVEGIRPVISDTQDQETSSLHYEYTSGAFKRLAMLAAWEGLNTLKEDKNHTSFDELWTILVEKIQDAEEQGEPITHKDQKERMMELSVSSTQHTIHGHIQDGKQRYRSAGKTYMRGIWEHRDQVNDYIPSKISNIIALTQNTKGGCHGFILWILLKELRKIESDLKKSKTPQEYTLTDAEKIEAVTYALSDSTQTFDFEDVPQYVMVIDEINRGNISKILGELMTLLEPSKRLGAADEVRVRLPYSGDIFAVPPNLHIIGTMNTSDRSIALMDVALRRRFTFRECMPRVDVLCDVLERRTGSEVWAEVMATLLEDLNARIRFLVGREYQLGHAYLLDAVDVWSWRTMMVERIIPLLVEYTHEDLAQVAMILGCACNDYGQARRQDHAVDASSQTYRAPMLSVVVSNDVNIFGFSMDYASPSPTFEISPDFINTTDAARVIEYIECCLVSNHDVCHVLKDEMLS